MPFRCLRGALRHSLWSGRRSALEAHCSPQKPAPEKVRLPMNPIDKALGAPAPEKPGKDGEEEPKKTKTVKEDPFGKMSVDEFFQGGFEIPKMSAKNSKQSKKIVLEKLGKRKRTEPEEEDDDSSEASFEEAPVLSDSEEGGDGEWGGVASGTAGSPVAATDTVTSPLFHLQPASPPALSGASFSSSNLAASSTRPMTVSDVASA